MVVINQISNFSDNMLHLWHIYLPPFFNFDADDSLLNQMEKNRKSRYIFEKHQIRFGTCRKLVRVMLAYYLKLQPKQLVFAERFKGKPHLEHDPLYFNVSHSSDYLALAIHPSLEIGVDIEAIKERDFIGLAEHSFSNAEIAAVKQHHHSRRAEIFYRIWSQKEAFIKQNGQGLSYPLADFTVNHELPGGLLSVVGEEQNAYLIESYLAHPGIQAAFCIKAQEITPVHFTNDHLREIL